MPGKMNWKTLYSFEYAQLKEEGYQIGEDLDPRIVETQSSDRKLSESDWEKYCRELWQLCDSGLRLDYPFYEPNDYNEIIQNAEKPPEITLLDIDRYREKIRGAWHGRCAGVILGKPLETNLDRQSIKNYLESVNAYPLSDWVPAYSETLDIHTICPKSAKGNIKYVEDDDDIRYTILALNLEEKDSIGVSNFNLAELKAACKLGQVDIIQNCYSLLWRWMESDIIPFCTANHIAFATYSPLVQGILSGKFTHDLNPDKLDDRKRVTLFRKEWFGKCIAVAEGLRYVAEKYDKTPSQAAINWILSQNGISSVVFGAKNRSQLQEIVGAVGWQFEKADLAYLDRLSRTITDDLPRNISIWW